MSKIPSLYRDADWLIVNKTAGLPAKTAHSGELGLVEWIELHHGLRLHVGSGLDAGASGVLVFALTPEAKNTTQKIHEQELSGKIYYFISDRNASNEKKWLCRRPLDDKKCESSFEFLKERDGYSLYRAEVTHERPEQVRRHAAASGIAILGDREYGGTHFPRLCLHCGEIRWPGLPDAIKAEIPQSFGWLPAGWKGMLIEAAIAYERRLDRFAGITNAFRCIHRGELRGRPLAIDRFGSWLCVTGFDEEVSSKKLLTSIKPVLEYFQNLFGCKGGVVRTNRRDPHRRTLFGDVMHWGEKPPETFQVREHELLFEVVLNDSQHVGLFLDQRDSRRRIGRMAHGKRVANLFSFTCSFSVVAANAGAEVVFSIDLAAGALERGKQNFAQNGLTETGCGKFIKEDVQKWLARQVRKKRAHPAAFQAWDIVICDPPVFASSGKGRSFSVEKAWPELAEQVREILSNKGVALFCNNHRSGNERYYRSELEKHFSAVTRLRPPFDFPELPDSPPHVRIYWCEV
ncbi:MAG: hypothetical protein GY801_21145 [bacterium]|nr:hypothetical protein [bacterium]